MYRYSQSPKSEAEIEAEKGLITGKQGGDKQTIFVFDDPTTPLLLNDYHMHPCECFTEDWGSEPPVTSEAFAAALSDSMTHGTGFNNLSPIQKLWVGPYSCGPSFILVSLVDIPTPRYSTAYTIAVLYVCMRTHQLKKMLKEIYLKSKAQIITDLLMLCCAVLY